jgi:Transcription factor WhiB/Helix-turn-helix domain
MTNSKGKSKTSRVQYPPLEAPRRGALPDPTYPAPDRYPDALRDAACRDADHELFTVDMRSRSRLKAARAQTICDSCPVLMICREYAMANEPFGFWGGMDAYERLELRGKPLPSYAEREESRDLKSRLKSGVSVAVIAREYGVTQRSIERWKRRASIRLLPMVGGANARKAA